MLPYEYSEKETELFKILGLYDSVLNNPHCPPVMAYMTAAYTCFMENTRFEKHIHESVWRCNSALIKSKARLTKEFDNLIILKNG